MNLLFAYAERKRGACAILNTSSSVVSIINQFVFHNFLCTIADAVHSSYPCYLVSYFHVLCHALSSFHLLDDEFKAKLCLLIQISQICPEFTAKAQIIETNGVMLHKVISVHPTPTTNRSVFFRQANIGNIVITTTNICKFLYYFFLQS